METTRRSSLARIFAALATLALVGCLALAGCSSGGSSSSSSSSSSGSGSSSTAASSTQEKAADELTIPVTVSCALEDSAFEESMDVSLPAEATALDALKATGLEIEENNGFVTSIAGVANEGMNGWTYTIDNEVPDPYVGASEFKLSEGMTVQWTYYISE